MSEVIRTILWRAELAIPRVCPNPHCRQPFQKNGKGGYFLRFFWRELPEEVINEFAQTWFWPGHETQIIVCSACHNTTLQVVIERRDSLSKREARQFKQLGYRVAPTVVMHTASQFPLL